MCEQTTLQGFLYSNIDEIREEIKVDVILKDDEFRKAFGEEEVEPLLTESDATMKILFFQKMISKAENNDLLTLFVQMLHKYFPQMPMLEKLRNIKLIEVYCEEPIPANGKAVEHLDVSSESLCSVPGRPEEIAGHTSSKDVTNESSKLKSQNSDLSLSRSDVMSEVIEVIMDHVEDLKTLHNREREVLQNKLNDIRQKANQTPCKCDNNNERLRDYLLDMYRSCNLPVQSMFDCTSRLNDESLSAEFKKLLRHYKDLKESTRQILTQYLSSCKTPKGHIAWRLLPEWLEISDVNVDFIGRAQDPANDILDIWANRREASVWKLHAELVSRDLHRAADIITNEIFIK